MASSLKNLSDYNEKNIPSAEKLKFGIVVSEWNSKITHALFKACKDTLLKHDALEKNIFVEQVPGTFELPLAAKLMASNEKLDAVICLGCVIRGETSHNEYINHAVAHALTQMSIFAGKPFIFGVITPNNEQQALDRAGGRHGNKGVEAAVTAIRMAVLKEKLSTAKSKIGFS